MGIPPTFSRYFKLVFFAIQFAVIFLIITTTFSPEIFWKTSDRSIYPSSIYGKSRYYELVPLNVEGDALPRSSFNHPLYPLIKPPSLDYNKVALLFSFFFVTGLLIAMTIDHFSSRYFLLVLKAITTITILIIVYLLGIKTSNFSKRVERSYESSCKLAPVNPQIDNGKLEHKCPPKIDWFIEEYMKNSDKYNNYYF